MGAREVYDAANKFGDVRLTRVKHGYRARITLKHRDKEGVLHGKEVSATGGTPYDAFQKAYAKAERVIDARKLVIICG